MSNCYNCGSVLDVTNSTDEHIILNAIGGRLKSKDLLCRTCNSTFGEGCDSELAHQLSFLASHLMIEKERGIIQPISGKTASGEEYKIIDGMTPMMANPIFKKVVDGDKINYEIRARNKKEMIALLKGLQRKHPGLNLEEAMQSTREYKTYLREPIHLQQVIGGELAFKSILKTAIGFYLENKGERKFVEHLIPKISHDEKVEVVYHHNPPSSYFATDEGEVLHVLHLVGDPTEKILYCYVQFFSTYSFIVLLSDNYTGNAFVSSYAYDVLKRQTVEKKIKTSFSKTELHLMASHNFYDDSQTIVERMNRVMSIAQNRQSDKAISNLVSEAIHDVFSKEYGDEPIITEQMIHAFSNRIAEDFVRFRFRNLSKEDETP